MKKIILTLILVAFAVSVLAQECTLYEIKCSKKEPLFRRIFINHLAFSVLYENRGQLGYEKGINIGITHELDYRGDWLFRNSVSVSPQGKVDLGGYYLQADNRTYYMIERWKIGAGLSLGYTSNSAWNKTNLFGAVSLGYRISDGYYQSNIYGDFVFGKYFDEAKTTQWGIEMLNISDLPYRFQLISKIGFYSIGSELCQCGHRDVVTASVGIGFKL